MHSEIQEINVQELKAMRDALTDGLVLLDVRESWEIEFAEIAWSKNIPMNLVPDRMPELPKSSTLVVMCHHGGRSLAVAQYLAHHGYEKIYNLAGGINAWSSEIDPAVPLY